MSSRRLRQIDRDVIVKRLLIHKFRARATELVEAMHKMADAFYLDAFTQKERDLMDSLPKGWLPESVNIGVKLGDKVEYISFGGTWGLGVSDISQLVDRAPYGETNRVIPHHLHGGVVKVYEATHPLAEIHTDWCRERNKLKEEVSVARAQVYAALNAHSTVNKLLKEWPEIEPFLSQPKAPAHPVPAIPTVQLNTLLGLPA